MSEIVLSVEEAEATPCDWNGHRLMKHQWWDTSDGHQRCANCKHVRTKPAEPVAEPQAPLEDGLIDAVIDVLSHLDNCDKCGLTDAYKNRLRAALEGKRA